MKGTFTWSFEPQGEKTKATLDVRYEVAGGVLGKEADAMLLERTNDKTMEEMLENLRRVFARERVSS